MKDSPGVYYILLRAKKLYYVGSSKHVQRRIYQHRGHLKKGTHSNSHLQSAWNKYGADAFDFIIVKRFKTATPAQLERSENWWISHLDAYENGFNQLKNAYSPKGFKLTPPQKKKLKKQDGEANDNAKLTEKQVRALYRLCIEGNTSARSMALKYSLSDTHVYDILSRKKSWKKLPLSASEERALAKGFKALGSARGKGARNPRAQVTEAQVREMRRLYAQGTWTYPQLAEKFKIKRPTVAAIVSRRTWKHV